MRERLCGGSQTMWKFRQLHYLWRTCLQSRNRCIIGSRMEYWQLVFRWGIMSPRRTPRMISSQTQTARLLALSNHGVCHHWSLYISFGSKCWARYTFTMNTSSNRSSWKHYSTPLGTVWEYTRVAIKLHWRRKCRTTPRCWWNCNQQSAQRSDQQRTLPNIRNKSDNRQTDRRLETTKNIRLSTRCLDDGTAQKELKSPLQMTLVSRH